VTGQKQGKNYDQAEPQALAQGGGEIQMLEFALAQQASDVKINQRQSAEAKTGQNQVKQQNRPGPGHTKEHQSHQARQRNQRDDQERSLSWVEFIIPHIGGIDTLWRAESGGRLPGNFQSA